MVSVLNTLEDRLVEVNKKMPELPKNTKDLLVKYWPLLTLVIGLLQLLAALSLWRAGHVVNRMVDYANQMSQVYGGTHISNHLGVFYWLSLGVLIVDAVIFLMAYPALKAHRKAGWDLLFFAASMNLVYGLVSVFDSSYGGFGKLLSTIVGSAIGYYFLLQVRSYYTTKTAHQKTITARV